MNHVYAFRIEFACHYLRWSSAKGRGGRMLVLQPDQDTGFDRPTLARIENEIDEGVSALVLPGRRACVGRSIPSLATKHFSTAHGRQAARGWLGVD